MTEPRQTNPTPTAVPWTPDMMTPQSTHPAPAPNAQPHMQPNPVQAAPQYQPPQSEYMQPAAPQAYAPPPQHPAPQAFAPQTFEPQGQGQMAQPHLQPPQYVPQTMHNTQPPISPQMAQHPHYASPQQQQPYVQPGAPPPLMPSAPQADTALEPKESKSFIVNLFKRSPKPQPSEQELQTPAASGSLFNKNFILGAVTGLVIGAFILPMALNMFGGDTPVQSQAQAQAGQSSIVEITPVSKQGDTFLDAAIAADTP